MNLRKTEIRRLRIRRRIEVLLMSLSEGTIDVYEGYRTLYGFWCSYNAAVPELKPLFRIPGIEPDGRLSVTDAFRAQVRSLAGQVAPLFSDSKTEAS